MAGSQNVEWTQKQIQAENQNFDVNKGFIYNDVKVQEDKNMNCEIQGSQTKNKLWLGDMNEVETMNRRYEQTVTCYDLRTKKVTWSTKGL